jgi:hypothetical protein
MIHCSDIYASSVRIVCCISTTIIDGEMTQTDLSSLQKTAPGCMMLLCSDIYASSVRIVCRISTTIIDGEMIQTDLDSLQKTDSGPSIVS